MRRTSKQWLRARQIVKEKIELKVADSKPMSAYVARPRAADRIPGLMVFQEAFGVNSHIRNVTERFAAQGYVAIAPELFHRRRLRDLKESYKRLPRR